VADRGGVTAAEDRALVQSCYDAFAQRDLDTVRGFVTDDVEFRNPGYAIEDGVRTGVDAFLEVVVRLHDSFDYVDVKPGMVERHGDQLLVEFRARVRGRESGATVDDTQGHLWELRDGKVSGLSWFRTVEEARAALEAGPSNADLVRRLYEEWNAGDVEIAMAGISPDVEWVEPRDNPDGSEWHGREGVLAALTHWTEPFDAWSFEVFEIEEAGDQVLVGVKQSGRGRSSGASFESDGWHVWTVRNGLGTRMEMFRARAEALAAMGQSRAV
jgi:ketosteroid isomerase-like protein